MASALPVAYPMQLTVRGSKNSRVQQTLTLLRAEDMHRADFVILDRTEKQEYRLKKGSATFASVRLVNSVKSLTFRQERALHVLRADPARQLKIAERRMAAPPAPPVHVPLTIAVDPQPCDTAPKGSEPLGDDQVHQGGITNGLCLFFL